METQNNSHTRSRTGNFHKSEGLVNVDFFLKKIFNAMFDVQLSRLTVVLKKLNDDAFIACYQQDINAKFYVDSEALTINTVLEEAELFIKESLPVIRTVLSKYDNIPKVETLIDMVEEARSLEDYLSPIKQTFFRF